MRKNRSSRQAERAQSPVPPLAYDRCHRARQEYLLAIFAYERWCHQARIRGIGLVSCIRAQCSQNSTPPAPQIVTEGSAPSIFDPTLKHSTEQVVMFWQPPS